MITVTINQKQETFPTNTSLQEALDQLEVKQQGIAVAIAQDVIPKTEWANTTLQDGQNIIIIKATQGG